MNATLEPPAAAVAPPGNMSERQLAAALSKSAPPQPTEDKQVPAAETPAVDSIPTATPTSETPPPAEKLITESAPSDAPPEGPGGLPPEPEPEPTEQPETTEPPKAGLPQELAEAIELAKADGKKGVADLLNRVHKLVDQRDTERNARLAADEKAAKLELDLNEAREAGSQAVPVPINGEVHPEVRKVAAEISNVDQWRRWCDEHPDGGEIPDGKGGKVELDSEGVRAARRGLDDQRSELVARKVNVEAAVKREFATHYQQQHATAQKLYPELFQKDSQESKVAQQFLAAIPGLKQFPDYEIVIGRYLKGMKLELAQAKAATNGATRKATPAREPTPVVSEPPAAQSARGLQAEDKEVQEAEARYQKSGKTADLAKLNAAKMRAQRIKR